VKGGGVKERRVQITVRAPAGLLDPLPKKKLADFALVQAPESRPLLRLTARRIDPFA